MEDLTGKTFSDLTAVRHIDNTNWEWLCSCGKTVVYKLSRVLTGHTRSCGCRRYRVSAEFKRENSWRADRSSICSRCLGIRLHTEFRKTFRQGVAFPRAWCRTCDNETRNEACQKTPEDRLAWAFRTCRNRCGQIGLPFNLDFEDFLPIPTSCPIFKTPMNYDGDRDSQPTFDRLIPLLGYVKGNVRLISHRANRIKSDASIDELQQLADWAVSCAAEPLPELVAA